VVVRSFLLALAVLLAASNLAHAQQPTPTAPPLVHASPAPAPQPTTAVHADQEARASFEAGKAAFDNGDYAAALVQFEHAYALSQRSLLLYNLGLAHDRLQHEERALEAYEAYLAANPNDERAADARARVKVLRAGIDARRAAASAPAASAPRDEPLDPKRRRRRLWIGVGFGVAAIGAGVAAAFIASKDDDEPGSRQPNSGVHIEALSW
jgi:tetratricopeptide (TPR) repeat protein